MKSMPPWPPPFAFSASIFHNGCSYSLRYFSSGSHSFLLASPVDEDFLFRILAHGSLGSLEENLAATRMRRLGIVRERDGLARRRLDHRTDYVAHHVVFFGLHTVGAECFFGEQVQAQRLAAHGNQANQLVAAIDVHALRDRPQSVRGIDVAIDFFGIGGSPKCAAAVGEHARPAVVQVSALAVKERASRRLAAFCPSTSTPNSVPRSVTVAVGVRITKGEEGLPNQPRLQFLGHSLLSMILPLVR